MSETSVAVQQGIIYGVGAANLFEKRINVKKGRKLYLSNYQLFLDLAEDIIRLEIPYLKHVLELDDLPPIQIQHTCKEMDSSNELRLLVRGNTASNVVFKDDTKTEIIAFKRVKNISIYTQACVEFVSKQKLKSEDFLKEFAVVVFNTLSHELRHYYQFTKGIYLPDASKLVESKNSKEYNESFDDYEESKIEIDANNFAYEHVKAKKQIMLERLIATSENYKKLNDIIY